MQALKIVSAATEMINFLVMSFICTVFFHFNFNYYMCILFALPEVFMAEKGYFCHTGNEIKYTAQKN